MTTRSLLLGTACTAAFPAAELLVLRRRFRHAHEMVSSAVRHLGEFDIASGPDPLRLLVLGDSVAGGWYIERFEQTLTGLVAAALAAEHNRPVHVINLACPGATTRELLQEVPENPQADVALVVIGANDIAKHIPLGCFERNLDETLSRLGGIGEVLLLGPADISSVPLFPFWLRQLTAWRMRAYIERMERVCLRHTNTCYVWAPPAAGLPKTLFACDRFHPNAEAHGMLAEYLLSARQRRLVAALA